MTLSPKAQQLLALQHKKYLQSLPDKKLRIDRYWQAIQKKGWTQELSTRLRTELHRLAGSAGSYGLSSLGKRALDLDVMLAGDMKTSNSEFDHGPEFAKLMEELYKAMDGVISGFETRP